MAILGLISTSDLSGTQSETARRKVFYQYPQGAAPLMGLLSMTETQETDKPSFGWWEERWQAPRTQTAVANADGPFTNTSGTDLTTGGSTLTAGTSARIYVDDASVFHVGDIVRVYNVATTGTATYIQAIVTAINTSGADYLTVRWVMTVANVTNLASNVDKYVCMVGTAAAEGDTSKTGSYTLPIEISNYTQIYRTPFHFTRTALKMGQRFDSTGTYRDRAKKMALRHMVALEQSIFWGEKRTDTATTQLSESTPERKVGGLLWFLKQWELRNVSNGGAFEYATGESSIASTAWDGDLNKRYLKINGSITKDQFDYLLGLLFRKTNDTAYEKICLCDAGLLSVINSYAERFSVKTTTLKSKEDTFGMAVTMLETIHGTLYFKSHPLFTDNPALANCGFVVDVNNIVYRPLQDCDTDLLKNRQAPDYDGRKDEWLTEAGFEIQYPESHAYIEGLSGITV